jgi:hypothetical protein
MDELILQNKVDIVDSDGDLYMVHFTDEFRHDPDINQYRGDIYSDDTLSRVVCKGTGLIEEKDWTPGVVHTNTVPIYQSPPGTILRMFHSDKSGWNICTNRRINAFTSRWNNRQSFGQLFLDILGIHREDKHQWSKMFNVRLQPDKQYTFLLVHDEFVHLEQHGVYLIDTTDDTGTSIPLLTQPSLLHNNIRALPLACSETVCSVEPEFGYLWKDIHTGRWTRWTSARYRQIMDLNGNHPDPRQRYMQLDALDDKTRLAQYLLLRPSVADMKLADDHAWRTIVERLLTDESYRESFLPPHTGVRNRWALMAQKYMASQAGSVELNERIRLKSWVIRTWFQERFSRTRRT